jgi:hypothetical protein
MNAERTSSDVDRALPAALREALVLRSATGAHSPWPRRFTDFSNLTECTPDPDQLDTLERTLEVVESGVGARGCACGNGGSVTARRRLGGSGVGDRQSSTWSAIVSQPFWAVSSCANRGCSSCSVTVAASGCPRRSIAARSAA